MLYDAIRLWNYRSTQVEIELPQDHYALQRALYNLGCEKVPPPKYVTGHQNTRYRTEDLTAEMMEAIYEYWPHFSPMGQITNPLPRPQPDYTTYDFFGVLADLNLVRVVNTTCQHIMTSHDRVMERFEGLDDEITRGLGYYVTKSQYEQQPHLKQGDGHVQFIRNIVDKIEDYGEHHQVRQGSTVTIPLQECVERALNGGLATYGKYFGDTFTLSERHFQLCVLAAVLQIDEQATITADGLLTIQYNKYYFEKLHKPGDLRTDKFTVPAVSWILISSDDKTRIAHISFVGSTQAVRRGVAVVTSPMKRSIMLYDPTGYGNRISAYRMDTHYKQYTNDSMLPDSGVVHLAMDCEMIYSPMPDENFIHVSGNGLGATYNRDIFTAQLRRTLTLPFDDSWIPKIWEWGIKKKIIVPLKTLGCSAWLIKITGMSKHWTHILAELTVGRPLSAIELDVQTSGDLDVTAELDETLEEDKDEEEE